MVGACACASPRGKGLTAKSKRLGGSTAPMGSSYRTTVDQTATRDEQCLRGCRQAYSRCRCSCLPGRAHAALRCSPEFGDDRDVSLKLSKKTRAPGRRTTNALVGTTTRGLRMGPMRREPNSPHAWGLEKRSGRLRLPPGPSNASPITEKKKLHLPRAARTRTAALASTHAHQQYFWSFCYLQRK